MLPVESTCADCGGDCYKTCYANEPDLCQGCRDRRTAVKASQHADAAWQLGHELMQPMPPGWTFGIFQRADESEFVCSCVGREAGSTPWPKRQNYEATGASKDFGEAHRLCREQAWAKHTKNMEAERKAQ